MSREDESMVCAVGPLWAVDVTGETVPLLGPECPSGATPPSRTTPTHPNPTPTPGGPGVRVPCWGGVEEEGVTPETLGKGERRTGEWDAERGGSPSYRSRNIKESCSRLSRKSSYRAKFVGGTQGCAHFATLCPHACRVPGRPVLDPSTGRPSVYGPGDRAPQGPCGPYVSCFDAHSLSRERPIPGKSVARCQGGSFPGGGTYRETCAGRWVSRVQAPSGPRCSCVGRP